MRQRFLHIARYAVRREILAAAVLIAAIAAANFRFIARDRSDYAVIDACHYMDRALYLAHAFDDGIQFRDFRLPFNDSYDRLYPPVNWTLGALFARAAGVSPLSLRLYSACYLPLALIYVYALARLFLGSWGALLAVFLGGTASLVLESSRYFLQEAPLLLATAGFLYHLTRSRFLTCLPQTLLAAVFVGFGMCMKPQFCLSVVLPLGWCAGCGWTARAREGRRRLALTLLWQGALCGVAVGIAYWARPQLFQQAAMLGRFRTEKFSFILQKPFHDDSWGIVRGIAHWLMATILVMPRLSWPLLAVFAAGCIFGPLKLRKRGLAAAFLYVPLLLLSTNLIVWFGAHLESERYLGPLLVAYGIPIAAAAALIERVRIRRAALATLTIFCLIGWAGPRVAPDRFDCPPRPFFTALRFNGIAHKDYPLIRFKLWDEPVARPVADPSSQRLLAALQAADSAAPGRPARIACVCSAIPGDHAFVEYEHLASDRFAFGLVRSPGDLIGADFILLVIPAAPSAGEAPRNLNVPMSQEEYRAIALALESPGLRQRLGVEEIFAAGLPAGRVLRLYRRVAPATEEGALNQTLALLEAFAYKESQFGQCAKWLKQAGFPDASQALATLGKEGGNPQAASAPAASAPAGSRWGEAYVRLTRWLAAIRLPGPSQEKALAAREALQSGPPAGPGLILETAFETLRAADNPAAAALARSIVETYPAHIETWASAEAYPGLGIPKAIATAGKALAFDHYDEDLIVAKAVQTSAALARAGYGSFQRLRSERMAILERDQPNSLRVLCLQAAARDVAGESGPETEEIIRRALGMAGQAYTEQVDENLRLLLGNCYKRRYEEARAAREWRRGGWKGVETLLDFLAAQGKTDDARKTLRRAAGARFALSLRGSDRVRTATVREMASLDPALACRAFAEMNQTPMAEEFPLFTQLQSALGEEGRKTLDRALQRASVNFYSATRQSVYRFLLAQPGATRLQDVFPEEFIPSLSKEEQAFLAASLEGKRQASASRTSASAHAGPLPR